MRLAAFLMVLGGLLVVGCAPTDDELEAEELLETESAVSTGSSTVNLKFEGTCDFLRSCSKWSRGLPEGNVLWGCPKENTDHDGDGDGDYGVCRDKGLWVAGPSRSHCGRTARICRGTTCVEAKVKDVSVTRDWEASEGVLDALDLSYGMTGRCSGYGGGRVTVSSRK